MSDRAYLFAALAMLLLLLVVAILPHRSPGQGLAMTWTRSEIQAAPPGEPIVGFWIVEGQPVPVACVCYGQMFFEYNPATKYPAPLFGYPPVWWIGMPGGAQ